MKAIILLSLLLLTGRAALATSLGCIEYSDVEKFKQSDAVVIGTVNRIAHGDHEDVASATIDHSWKLHGTVVPYEFLIQQGEQLSVPPITEGEAFVLFLSYDRIRDKYLLKTCSPRIAVTPDTNTILFLGKVTGLRDN